MQYDFCENKYEKQLQYIKGPKIVRIKVTLNYFYDITGEKKRMEKFRILTISAPKYA